jgi:hypothetical protein
MSQPETSSIPSGIEAVKVNEILKTRYYDAGGITWWWNTANSHLDGKTPHRVWLSESEPTATTIEMVRAAAAAANIMGHAT